MIKLMVLVCILGMVFPLLKDIGKMIFNMVKVLKNGQMVVISRGHISGE